MVAINDFFIVTNLNKKTFFVDIKQQIITLSEYLQKKETDIREQFYLFFISPQEYDEIETATVFPEKETNNIYILVYKAGGLHNFCLKPFFSAINISAKDEFRFLCPGIIEQALEYLKMRKALEQSQEEKSLIEKKIYELNAADKSLAGVADPEQLMNLILEKGRQLTSADAGSICLVKHNNENKPAELHYTFFQNGSLQQNIRVNLTIPVSPKSIGGYCALTKETLNISDVYKINPEAGYTFNQKTDEAIGYKTKSMLVHPMLDSENQVLGLIQLANKLPADIPHILEMGQNIDLIQNFTAKDIELVQSLSVQASVCLKNTQLIADINKLFDNFVYATATAIENRDPASIGHSQRVSRMARKMARLISNINTGPYHNICFSDSDLKELHYACLLHDFGKLNIPEEILTKTTKLSLAEMQTIRQRFELIIKDIQNKTLTKKLELVEQMSFTAAQNHFLSLEEEETRTIEEVEDIIYFLIKTNEPNIMPESNFQQLVEIARREFTDPYGINKPWLTKSEVESLSVRKGVLSPKDRKIIDTHVTHSFTFLSRIPWPADLRRIPAIAYGHHELLSGEGYPNQLVGDEISLQSKIIVIVDIYDTLTAYALPYQKSYSVEKAVDSLRKDAKNGHLDHWLTELFIDNKVWQVVDSLVN